MAESRQGSEKKYNRLIEEKSPYLLQHATNPVDWYPWRDEAFERARREQKPIFLSIGYSTCHWCHVMERESFEDREAAGLLNDTFVAIKVDREERPDIDGIYMGVCQMLTGSGGWPLTIMMTPDRKPFFAATYIPKRGRAGRPGLMELIPQVANLWQTRRAELLSSSEQI
ncbi:MAG: thioredoxin domain-containing protein, partial [Syntrophales bacterium LBB04]|nr:thioredoxin domain-containing protein [Syntrophales bacterium LBB04]